MGPGLGGTWAGPATGWVVPALIAFLVVGVAAVVVALAISGARGRRQRARPIAPETILRERYALGELTRRQYRDALLDVAKDRYVRGELEVDEYEARLDELLREAPAPASGLKSADDPTRRDDRAGRLGGGHGVKRLP